MRIISSSSHYQYVNLRSTLNRGGITQLVDFENRGFRHQNVLMRAVSKISANSKFHCSGALHFAKEVRHPKIANFQAKQKTPLSVVYCVVSRVVQASNSAACGLVSSLLR
jgi:hypothetical protein